MENKKEYFPDGAIMGYIPNVHVLVSIRGKVIEKDYIRDIKHFIFRVQTDKEFEITNNNVRTQILVFHFVISKKLHRKYRKIIYNGNYIEITGILRQHDMFFGKNEIHDRFVIETHAAREYPRDEIPKFPDLDNSITGSIPNTPISNEIKKIPQLT
jgi:hypothetical protein